MADFDIIIVGAGTGGTTAARFAAQKGLDVCLIDSTQRENWRKNLRGRSWN